MHFFWKVKRATFIKAMNLAMNRTAGQAQVKLHGLIAQCFLWKFDHWTVAELTFVSYCTVKYRQSGVREVRDDRTHLTGVHYSTDCAARTKKGCIKKIKRAVPLTSLYFRSVKIFWMHVCILVKCTFAAKDNSVHKVRILQFLCTGDQHYIP